jgi:hypothetical protein
MDDNKRKREDVNDDLQNSTKNQNMGKNLLNRNFQFHLNDIRHVNLKKNRIKYDEQKKEFRIHNLNNFMLSEFISEISELRHRMDKLYPLSELKILCNLQYFADEELRKIKTYLETEDCVNIFKLKKVNILFERLIIEVCDSNGDVCGLSLNTEDFHFYSCKRFWSEYNLRTINVIDEKLKIKMRDDVLSDLTNKIKNKKISDRYENETLCWIDCYTAINNLEKSRLHNLYKK